VQTDHTTINGTIGGTLLTLFATIDVQDYVKTVILASVGAIVSFVVSKFLKWLG
jgi:mannitol-specific phosphotransferase system IIBC component